MGVRRRGGRRQRRRRRGGQGPQRRGQTEPWGLSIYMSIYFIYIRQGPQRREQTEPTRRIYIFVSQKLLKINQRHTFSCTRRWHRGKLVCCWRAFPPYFIGKFQAHRKGKKSFFLTEVSFFHLFLAILRFFKISRSKRLRVVILITSSSWQPPSSQFPMVILIIFLTKHFMMTARLECTDRPQCLRFYFKSRERDGPVPHPNLPKGGGTRWNARKWRNLCV